MQRLPFAINNYYACTIPSNEKAGQDDINNNIRRARAKIIAALKK